MFHCLDLTCATIGLMTPGLSMTTYKNRRMNSGNSTTFCTIKNSKISESADMRFLKPFWSLASAFSTSLFNTSSTCIGMRVLCHEREVAHLFRVYCWPLQISLVHPLKRSKRQIDWRMRLVPVRPLWVRGVILHHSSPRGQLTGYFTHSDGIDGRGVRLSQHRERSWNVGVESRGSCLGIVA